MVEAISLGAGLAWASGLRLYLTVLIAGVFARAGFIHLPDTLAVLTSPWVIGSAAVLAVAEFLADKVPAFDSLWDAVHVHPDSRGRGARGGVARPRRSRAPRRRGPRGRHARRFRAYREGGHARTHQSVAGTDLELDRVDDGGRAHGRRPRARILRAAAVPRADDRLSRVFRVGVAAPLARRVGRLSRMANHMVSRLNSIGSKRD